MKLLLLIMASLVLGVIYLLVIAFVFNVMKWPYFNGWALAHGSMIIVYPVSVFMAFLSLLVIPKINSWAIPKEQE